MVSKRHLLKGWSQESTLSQLGMLVKLATYRIYPGLPVLCPLNLENHRCSDFIYLSDVSGILAPCDGVVESMSLEIRQSWNLDRTTYSVLECQGIP